mgnify:FL=1
MENSKKFNLILALILICAVCLTVIGFVVIYLTKNRTQEIFDACLSSDKGYIDYAKEVYLDTETYPDMAEMGLFWTKWDEETKTIIQVPADSKEGAALVNPNKPTLINVHGVLLDGYEKQEKFRLNTKIANPEEFDIDANYVYLNYIWLRAGWNVANYHYNRFASEINPSLIEAKIWSNEGSRGVRYRHADGSYSANDVTEYSLAEHFAAEYIRAMKLLPSSMGNKEIRVAAHSMGGQLATATIFLLTELADHGQLPREQLPDRFALLDAYFSGSLIGDDGKMTYIGPRDINIRWSGKPLYQNHTGKTMIECLKAMNHRGIAVEYYTYEANFLKAGMEFLVPELIKLSSYVIVYPNFQGPQYSVITDGHNAVREWYLCSIYSAPVKDITDGAESSAYAPSAALPTEKLKDFYNKKFLHVGGCETVNASDDLMAQIYDITYQLDGGKSNRNPSYYTAVSDNIELTEPIKEGYVFGGWYDNPKFKGNPITQIDASAKKPLTLYAKWIKEQLPAENE